MEFKNQKQQRLGHVDFSRKGSIDEPITELVNFVNSLPNYFTTSSCSGRIIVFESALTDEQNDEVENSIPVPSKPGKKGCKWLFVSHSKVKTSEVEESFSKVSGNAAFKFEAMVMHIQCQTLQDAQQMHQAAVAAGFRNSGISIGGKGKTIVGVRSTHSLEAPLSKDGIMLVTPEYCQFLVECANQRMEENFIRINRFYENVRLLTKSSAPAKEGRNAKVKRLPVSSGDGTKLHKNKTGHTGHKGHQPQDHQDKQCRLIDNGLNAVPCDDPEDELCLFMFENT